MMVKVVGEYTLHRLEDDYGVATLIVYVSPDDPEGAFRAVDADAVELLLEGIESSIPVIRSTGDMTFPGDIFAAFPYGEEVSRWTCLALDTSSCFDPDIPPILLIGDEGVCIASSEYDIVLRRLCSRANTGEMRTHAGISALLESLRSPSEATFDEAHVSECGFLLKPPAL